MDNLKNMRLCPYFDRCSKNLCPLDYDLEKRRPKGQGKCKWMCEGRGKRTFKRHGVNGVSSTTITIEGKTPLMPTPLLKNVPKGNFKWLNSVSQRA